MEVGECRYTPVCDRAGAIMCECIVLRPWEDIVWFSHSDVDLTLWAAGIALARGDEATVAEADVAPLQLQGPRARDVLAGVADRDLAGLGRHRCAPMRVAGVDAVVSNTGWSREAGYELYPLGSDRAAELWDALCEAGAAHGLLVTGPNIVRAVEQGISDTQYATNSDMNPIEAGMGSLLDLDRPDFVGRDALRAVRENGPARRTVGLVCDGAPFPVMERHWPITASDGEPVGVARWAVYSFALERPIAIALVDRSAAGASEYVAQSPEGPISMTRHPFPFVEGTAS
jgi:aminomethyltransferase